MTIGKADSQRGESPELGGGSVVREGRRREEVCFPAQGLFPGRGD